MNLKIQYDLLDISFISKKIIEYSDDSKIFCFQGDLGAGKTTLIEEICRNLGSNDTFSSPTFSIINEYALGEKSIIHADLYRINSLEELLDTGFEDYLFSGNYCFIEWHQIAEPILPRPYFLIKIEAKSDMKRSLEMIEIKE